MSEKLFSIYDIYISCFIYFIYIYADHAAGVITNIMSKNSMKLFICDTFGKNTRQIRANIVESFEPSKKTRKQLRRIVNGYIDKENVEEADNY